LHDTKKGPLSGHNLIKIGVDDMKIWMGLMVVAAVVSTPALAKNEAANDGLSFSPVAYEALSAGKTREAIAILEASRADDPSRFINLGAAYARLGRQDDARRAYLAAIASTERADVELSNGLIMDSRELARIALQRLSSPQLAAR
jgi:tetratricopeptide (TPR) repeat protein